MLIETWWWILRKNEKLKKISQWHEQLGRKKQSEYSCTPMRSRPCDHLVTIPDALPLRYRRNVDELRLCHSKHCITIPPIYKSGPARAFEYSGIQGLFSFRYTVFWCYKIWVLERFSLDCRKWLRNWFGFGFTTPFGWLVYLLWFWFYDSQVKTALSI